MLRLLSRPVFEIAAGARHESRLAIFTYHRVLARADAILPGEVPAASFAAQMRLLANTCEVLPLFEAAERLREGRLPVHAASVTFDDGYATNFTVALPILRRLRLPATFFICTGFMDGRCMWNDAVIEAVRGTQRTRFDLAPWGLGEIHMEGPRALALEALLARLKQLEQPDRERCVDAIVEQARVERPRDLMMNAEQVVELHRAGFEIGAHTDTHPILTRVDFATARREVQVGRDRLHSLIGRSPRCFAYPNGRPHQDYAAEHVSLVRELGFRVAVSTAAGIADRESDSWQLPRLIPWRQSPARFLWRMLSAYRIREQRVGA